VLHGVSKRVSKSTTAHFGPGNNWTVTSGSGSGSDDSTVTVHSTA
jgi:hypothetical protein